LTNIERDNIVVFNYMYISVSGFWPDKRGWALVEWPYKRGTAVIEIV